MNDSTEVQTVSMRVFDRSKLQEVSPFDDTRHLSSLTLDMCKKTAYCQHCKDRIGCLLTDSNTKLQLVEEKGTELRILLPLVQMLLSLILLAAWGLIAGLIVTQIPPNYVPSEAMESGKRMKAGFK